MQLYFFAEVALQPIAVHAEEDESQVHQAIRAYWPVAVADALLVRKVELTTADCAPHFFRRFLWCVTVRSF